MLACVHCKKIGEYTTRLHAQNTQAMREPYGACKNVLEHQHMVIGVGKNFLSKYKKTLSDFDKLLAYTRAASTYIHTYIR